MMKFCGFLKNKKNKNTEDVKNETLSPIIFKNTPIENDSQDIFDFKTQVEVLNEVEESGAKIIGIIGDYGSGKSSITEMFENHEKEKKNKTIRINLWDEYFGTKGDEKFQAVMKSFFYQLAYGNTKHNKNFSEYINNRFNKNQGRVSFRLATRKSFILIGFAALLVLLFFSFNNISIEILKYLKEVFEITPIEKAFFSILYSLRYSFLVGAGALIVWATIIAAPVFMSWKSEGTYTIDNSDISEIYTLIVGRILSRGKKKVIVFIDDLDRTANRDTVICFLKELYRSINLLPEEYSKKILFIISLKAEETLKNKENDSEKIYPKIFDYTLHIKSIHCENYYDVVKDLLEQNEKNLQKVFSEYGEDFISEILNKLKWLYQDENLTIRELKDRLNETFLLYQTLHARDYKNSSVDLKKAAAVTFLKRKYPDYYYKILANEHKFAELIRDCYKICDKNKVSEKLTTFFDSIFESKEKLSLDSIFSDTLSEMLAQNLIDDDFALYLYNYPRHSYIKTLDEKELFNSITLNNKNFLTIDNCNEKLEKIIKTGKGFAIIDAFEKFPSEKIPEIVYESELIFRFVIENLESQRKLLYKEIENECKKITIDSIAFYNRFSKILNYSFDKNIYDEMVSKANTAIYENLKVLNAVFDENIIDVRKKLILYLSKKILLFINLFSSDELPCLSEDEFLELKKVSVLLPILKEMSEARLKEFDDLYLDSIEDADTLQYLLKNKLYKSVLFSYEKTNKLQEFDFSDVETTNDIINISKDLLDTDESIFLKIREEILLQIQNDFKEIEYYKLYLEPYPVITKKEFEVLELKNLYQVLDYERIDESIVILLQEFSKIKVKSEIDVYLFLRILLFSDEDNRISDTNIIKDIVENLDFQNANILRLEEEQFEEIIQILTPIYELNSFKGCINFMKIIHHLIPSLEKDVISEAIANNEKSLAEYLSLLNELDEATDETVELLKDKKINCALSPAVTNKLYKSKYFIRYIIGKSLYNGQLLEDSKIGLEAYYKAFRSSEEAAKLFDARPDLLEKFVYEEMYLNELPIDKLKYFYSLRQTIKLTKFIMEKLNDNVEEQKNYLHSITHFNEENDALQFISLITSEKYISLLYDTDLFWYLWHKMWKPAQKAKFTKVVNKQLGTNYKSTDKEVEI